MSGAANIPAIEQMLPAYCSAETWAAVAFTYARFGVAFSYAHRMFQQSNRRGAPEHLRVFLRLRAGIF
jgi:hypothetical protein